MAPPARDLPGIPAVRRVAMLSVHTSPLDAPGGGDAGGMNVYMVETARRLADRGVDVEIFTRATASDQPPVVPLYDGVQVRHVTAGPFQGLAKDELPAQLCAFTAGVLRDEVRHDPGWYDVIHSHYWLSGQVGYLARERWGVPLVHSSHTLAKVKNLLRADGDSPEPRARVIGEEQVVGRGRSPRRLHRRRGAGAGRALRRRPGPDPHRRSRRRPGGVHPRRAGRRPPAPRAAAGRADAAVRRADPAAEGPGRPGPRRGRAARPTRRWPAGCR